MICLDMEMTKYYWRRTKIVCTLGPATGSPEKIRKLILAGMDIARLNLSHGTFEAHAGYIRIIRDLTHRMNRNIAVMIDLPGPKYRIGKLKKGRVTLRKGQRVNLTTRDIIGEDGILPVNLANLAADVRTGDTVLLADGDLELRVEKTDGADIRCRVIVGGILEEAKGVVIPRRHISAPYITDAMREDIHFAISQQADYLALSFISSAEDARDVKKIMAEHQADIPLIAKIEREEAVKNLDKIMTECEAVMVARGDLGVEMPLEKVPLVQKDVIRRCNLKGKPVITATEMLESMITEIRPTRAETTDVANAVLDGTDALMLSGETSIGKYPAQAVKMMSVIARETEKTLPYEKIVIERGSWIEPVTDETISYNACVTAQRLNAKAIVAYTQTGSTARRVSKYRPKVPILALTPSDEVYRRLLICWGVFPIKIQMPPIIDEMLAAAADAARSTGLAKKDDLIVITAGIPAAQTGNTNMLKIEKIG